MYTIQITGFKTKRQVEEFYSWFEGQGEQDLYAWAEDHSVTVNLQKPACWLPDKITFTFEVKE